MIRRLLPFLLCCLILPLYSAPVIRGGRPVPAAGRFGGGTVELPPYRERNGLRGIWIATEKNIDFPVHGDAASFRSEASAMLERIRQAGFNAVFFQVRPKNDAFYPSTVNPWSRHLSGAEGRPLSGDPGFDPLAFLISESHRRGLEFHAWLNPYRVHSGTPMRKMKYLETLAKGNFAKIYGNLVLEIKTADGLYTLLLNPGEPRVRNLIFVTVRELACKYDLDGIVFDDYFYPYGGSGDADAYTWKNYTAGTGMSLGDWRRRNVNQLIAGVRKEISDANARTGRRIRFGVSPFGIWRNRASDPAGSLTAGTESYTELAADSRLWIKSGWVDYIIPQLYWAFDHKIAAYAALCRWWCGCVAGTPVKLYISHAVYMLGSSSAWPDTELADQLRFDSALPQVSGEVMFSYRRFFSPDNAVMKSGAGKVRSLWRR